MNSKTAPSHYTIGVLAGWPLYNALGTHNFLDAVLRGIRVAAHEYDCHLLIACGLGSARDDDLSRPAWPVPADDNTFIPVGPWNTDGLIVINPLLSPERSAYIQALREQGHPVVFLGTAEKGSAVALDNESGIQQAIHHLVEHGHHAIAFIAGSKEDATGDSGERYQAYMRFTREYGLDQDARLVAYGNHNYQGGKSAMKRILASGVSCTAVLASNDESAIGAMAALQEQGIAIPEEMAVIGFDDRPTALAQNPPLTTIHSSTFERGYRTLELLVGMIRQQHTSQDSIIMNSSSHLIIRHSCGCQPDLLFERTLQFTSQLPTDTKRAINVLLNMMAHPVLTESSHLGAGVLFGMCRRLYDAFADSLQQEELTPFQRTFSAILHEVEEAEEDAHVWQMAVTTLAEYFIVQAPDPAAVQLARVMLRWAQVTISEHIQRQYRAYVVNQNWIASRIGALNAYLVETTSREEIYEVLARYLPDVGIEHAAIAYFEDETAVDQTILHLHPILAPIGDPIHLPVRSFAPATLLTKETAHHLSLFPLSVDQVQIGFVVFETENIVICETVVRQISAALRSAKLYQDAREGRRLAEKARQLAEEANQMKGRFLSMVSHELRTPLALIVGLSDMLLRDEKQGELLLETPHSQQLERIHTNAQHLDGLIQDVLDLTHGDMNQLAFAPEPMNLSEIIGRVCSIGQQLAEQKGLEWQASLPENSIMVYGDRGRLRQVLFNIINNAVKFTAKGFISFSVMLCQTDVEIRITDSGVGIPEAEQEAIFEPFHQSQRTAQRGYGGLGLGLAICKHFVARHQGEIGLYPTASGTSFYVRLPLLIEEREMVSQALLSLDETAVSYVLLIEPAHIPAKPLLTYLQEEGYTVRVLTDESDEEMLTTLKSNPPQTIIFDMRITSERGWHLLRQLKNKPYTQNIPIVFYELAQAENKGAVLAFDYASKPIGSKELAQTLARYAPLDSQVAKERYTILVVDDDLDILQMHTQLIQKQWPMYQVQQAHNGLEALSQMKKAPPDLVLLDLMMPELDGFAVLQRMRQEDALRQIPVIILTAQVLTAVEMRHLNQGVATVLKKGVFTVAETLDHIQDALEQTDKLGGEARRLVRHAMAYIHEHFAEPITRDDVADYVGVSKGYLSRSFGDELGVSPITYLNRYRVNQAKVLLQANRKTIAAIAYEVGFPNSSYFSRVFRKEVGLSPTAYQKRNGR